VPELIKLMVVALMPWIPPEIEPELVTSTVSAKMPELVPEMTPVLVLITLAVEAALMPIPAASVAKQPRRWSVQCRWPGCQMFYPR
jgi:hypothetical protein